MSLTALAGTAAMKRVNGSRRQPARRRSLQVSERMRAVSVRKTRSNGMLVRETARSRTVRLVYLDDQQPGFRRVRKGRGFVYLSPSGRRVADRAKLERFRSLAIPPAWSDVWISPSPHGHLQATGRDARGRKQYRYHEVWQESRNATKFSRLAEFGDALPEVRARVQAALAQPGLSREKVVAAVIHLLDLTGARVGNEEYAQANGSFGLTTLRNRHFALEAGRLRLRFRGKSGVRHSVEVEDRRLARVVQRCSELPGEMLFQYVDGDGEPRGIGSADVNDVLREWTSEEFTAKDFRTWSGSVLFLRTVVERPPDDPPKLTEAIRSVADRLGNTPAVCRKYYIHPALIDELTAGTLWETADKLSQRSQDGDALDADERTLIAILGRA